MKINLKELNVESVYFDKDTRSTHLTIIIVLKLNRWFRWRFPIPDGANWGFWFFTPQTYPLYCFPFSLIGREYKVDIFHTVISFRLQWCSGSQQNKSCAQLRSNNPHVGVKGSLIIVMSFREPLCVCFRIRSVQKGRGSNNRIDTTCRFEKCAFCGWLWIFVFGCEHNRWRLMVYVLLMDRFWLRFDLLYLCSKLNWICMCMFYLKF